MRGISWVAVAAAMLGVQACGASETVTTSKSSGAKVSERSTPPKPTPTPKPEVSLSVPNRTVQEDSLNLTGRVQPKGASVRVDGKAVDVSSGRFSLPVTVDGRGATEFSVVATHKGYVKDATLAVVTRELSATEKEALRLAAAARRANARALAAAENYLDMMGISYQGLYQQLSSSAGEGFTASEAQYAVDHVNVDWNQEAVQSARNYLQMMPMSRDALIDQLSSSAGEGFTYEQALYAVGRVY
jgi:hypothetical protein